MHPKLTKNLAFTLYHWQPIQLRDSLTYRTHIGSLSTGLKRNQHDVSRAGLRGRATGAIAPGLPL